jgi:hypothetical protein
MKEIVYAVCGLWLLIVNRLPMATGTAIGNRETQIPQSGTGCETGKAFRFTVTGFRGLVPGNISPHCYSPLTTYYLSLYAALPCCLVAFSYLYCSNVTNKQ